MGEFGVEDHHTWEVVEFVIHPTERREPRPVLIYPGNLTTARKEMMVPKDDMETCEYYKYPENCYTWQFNFRQKTQKLQHCHLPPTFIWTRIMVHGDVDNMVRP